MKKVNIIKIEDNKRSHEEDYIIREISLKMVISSGETLILPCSGDHVNEMITGYLYTNGYINAPVDIQSRDYHIESQTAYVNLVKSKSLLNGFGGNRDIKFSVPRILEFMETFSGISEQFKMTGAVHTAAIAAQNGVQKHFDDIGRHNAVDKLIGYGVTNNEPFLDKCLLLTCRISRSIIAKVISAGFPMVVSTSPPTDQALEMAKKNDIAMAGFVRGNRMNIYNGEESFL